MRHVVSELSALLDGALAPDERRAVESHLRACGPCRAERQRLAATLEVLARLSAVPEPSPHFATRLAARLREEPRRGWLARLASWRLVLPATGLAAAALGGLLLVRHQRDLERGAAARLELLEEWETVASMGEVETPEDAALIAQLDTLRRGERP